MSKKRVIFILLSCLILVYTGSIYTHNINSGSENQECMEEKPLSKEYENNKGLFVQKKVLDNGMVVLVRPLHTLPKVSVQIWYDVGSKDEQSGEKGIAHLIEHMIFKGTNVLSESDINTIAHKLSGSLNAFTSYDYTGYLFNMPEHNWREILPIIADCMRNARFDEQHLNSEMKAVIQELKMRNDNYPLTMAEDLLTTIFPDHPYHYPIIGYKQDLWTVTAQDLKKFYHAHYIPNNAVLVVVGDVNPEEVFELAKKYFSKIPPHREYVKREFYYNQDMVSKSVTLYRDVQKPIASVAFVVPGSSAKTDSALDILNIILGTEKVSRLYRKIVDEQQLATSFAMDSWELFDYSLLLFLYEPKKIEDVDIINNIIAAEIEDIIANGLSDEELSRAIKKAQLNFYRLLEDTEKQAYQIGKYFLAVGDENYIFKFLEESPDYYRKKIQEILAEYCRPVLAHKGFVLPLPKGEKKHWEKLQALSDQEDKNILSARARTTPVEPPVYADKVVSNKPKLFQFPKACETTLSNGIKLFYHDSRNTPKITVILDLKAKHYYDPEHQEGIANFVTSMLDEGTKNYTATAFSDELARYGMSLSLTPGSIMLTLHQSDFEKGLELLKEMLVNATFGPKEIEKVRAQILAEIKNYWDEPSHFVWQLLRNAIYKNHPYSKNALGTEKSINAITRDDLIQYYKKYISPSGARIAIVGDLQGYDVPAITERILGSWKGPVVQTITYPSLCATTDKEINYPISRDQIVLCFAEPSIERKHADYDKLLLFDQILGGGELGSMSSRLFQLREESGLFYTISGSLLVNAGEQPGMILVKTILSADRLQEGEKVIKKTLAGILDTLTPIELQEAKDAVANSLINSFKSDRNIAQTFLALDKYNMPKDYFDARAVKLEKITLDEVKQAVKKVFDLDQLLTVRIGRVDKKSSE
jgi:zinc protease